MRLRNDTAGINARSYAQAWENSITEQRRQPLVGGVPPADVSHGKGRIDYFTVKGSSDSGRDNNNDNTPPLGRGIAQPLLYTGPPPSAAEETLFDRLKNDVITR